MQVGANIMYPFGASLKVNRTLDEAKRTFLTVESSLNHKLNPPTFSVNLSRRLVANQPYIGFCRVYSGHYRLSGWGQGDLASQITEAANSRSRVVVQRDAASSMMVGIQWGKLHVSTLSFSTSLFQQLAQLNHQRKLSQDTILYLSTGFDIKQSSITSSWRLIHKVAELTKVGIGASLSQGGTIFTLEFDHYHQKATIPIMLLPQPNILVGVCASVVPLVTCFVGWYSLVRPHRARKLTQKLKDLREKHADLLLKYRQEAEDAILVMRNVVERKWQEESKHNGLVIILSLYGKIKNGKVGSQFVSTSDEGVIDVTIPVMSLVSESSLRIESDIAKRSLLGFYDPCFGEKKRLLIVYRFKGIYREVIVDDIMGISCPQRSTFKKNSIGYG
jgi:hypothetical protein